jgi:2-dehydro-3-deoxygluconokinase
VSVTAVTEDAEHASGPAEADVVDAFGAGDAALAAFLTCALADAGLDVAVERAAWACAFQHTIPGDAWRVRPADLEAGRHADRRILR